MGSVLKIINKFPNGLAVSTAVAAFAFAGGIFARAPQASASYVTLGSAAGFAPTSGPFVGYDLLVGNQNALTLGGSGGATFVASGGAIAQGVYSTSGNGTGNNPDSFTNVTAGGFYEGEWGKNCTTAAPGNCGNQYT